MEAEVQTRLTALLAERGLSVRGFDGQTLTVDHDPARDSEAKPGTKVDTVSLSRYVQDIIAQHPGSETLFPALLTVEVYEVN